MSVLKGAFRFTTSLAGKTQKRNIVANVGSATIGIRGTDVWGKSEQACDFIVLIEGEIEFTRAGQRVTMSEAQTLYSAPRGRAALPVTPVNADDLGRWAQETELQQGGDVASADGKWRVIASSHRNAAVAAQLAARLQAAGYYAEVSQTVVDNVNWARVVVPGFAARADAEAVATVVHERIGAGSPWVVARD